jgi:hypothetical protein
MGTYNVETKDKTRINFTPYATFAKCCFFCPYFMFTFHMFHKHGQSPIDHIIVDVLIICWDQFFYLGVKFHQVAIFFKLAKILCFLCFLVVIFKITRFYPTFQYVNYRKNARSFFLLYFFIITKSS